MKIAPTSLYNKRKTVPPPPPSSPTRSKFSGTVAGGAPPCRSFQNSPNSKTNIDL